LWNVSYFLVLQFLLPYIYLRIHKCLLNYIRESYLNHNVMFLFSPSVSFLVSTCILQHWILASKHSLLYFYINLHYFVSLESQLLVKQSTEWKHRH
jgi:hypothetical protein